MNKETTNKKTPKKITEAWNSLVRLLRYRPRTIAEASNRLQAKGFDQDIIKTTLDRAQQADLLNDSLFARIWIEDRLLNRPLSRRAMRQELTGKGIDDVLVDTALSKLYPPENEKRVALGLAKNRWNRYQHLDQHVKTRRMLSYLTRRGFSYPIAKDIIKLLEQEDSTSSGTSEVD